MGQLLVVLSNLAIYDVEDLEVAHAQFRMQRAERAEALVAGREPLVAATDAMADDVIGGLFSPLGDPIRSNRYPGQ